MTLPAILPTSPADARCARMAAREECAASLYVFEGTLESVVDRELTFVVTAVWQGAPPERVVVTTSGRRPLASASDVGSAYLIFALGRDPASLRIARCGSSGPLAASGYTQDALLALGRTRVAR